MLVFGYCWIHSLFSNGRRERKLNRCLQEPLILQHSCKTLLLAYNVNHSLYGIEINPNKKKRQKFMIRLFNRKSIEGILERHRMQYKTTNGSQMHIIYIIWFFKHTSILNYLLIQPQG